MMMENGRSMCSDTGFFSAVKIKVPNISQTEKLKLANADKLKNSGWYIYTSIKYYKMGFMRVCVSVWKLTGTLDVRKNSSRASREPSVEACTYTPFSSSFMALRVCFSSRINSSYKHRSSGCRKGHQCSNNCSFLLD